MNDNSHAARLPTGTPGLDEILHGGLLPGRTYLIVGAPGTGKTVLSLQWLLDGQRRGLPGLYVTLAEPADEILRNLALLGWDREGLDMLDLTPATEVDWEHTGEYQVFPPSEVERMPIWHAIYSGLQARRPKQVVIDSVTQLRYLSTDEYQFRKHILQLVAYFSRQGITAFLMFEPTDIDRDTSVALAVDGIFRLRRSISPNLAVALRSIEIEKLRGSDFKSGLHPLRITSAGIVVFPHRIEQVGEPRPAQRILSSGIAPLDELLGGGLESATTTLITGPTGVGKTVLGMQFLIHSASREKTALFTFEEAVSYLAARHTALGQPIQELLDTDRLRVVRINPLELYPDEFLSLVRRAVEDDGVKVIMIDSLRGYTLAMEEFGTPQAHIHNLVVYLNRMGVTTLLINEMEKITSTDLTATDLGVSHLADNVLILRYAEYAGQIIRVAACLKKRLGGFQPELRQFTIGPSGICVGDKLQHLSGVLTGLPTVTAAPVHQPESKL